jgi:hypothetical protein
MPGEEPIEPSSIAKPSHGPHKPLGGGGSRQILVGEMCPQGAGGRPGVAPLVMRNVGWTDNAAEVSAVVERGSVPRFAVYGVDGKVAGVFDTLGAADVGMPNPIAAGGYAGAPPCTYELPSAQAQGSNMATRAEDPRCTPATFGCGLAVAEIVRPDDPPETPSLTTGGACVSGESLAIDIDGDGTVESFPLDEVLDGTRSPANEWTATPVAGAPCKPQFQVFDIALAGGDPGQRPDPKSTVMMDVLGVVDLDGDGRREVVLALRFATVRTIAVFSATASAQRLELAGEAPSFPR